MGNKIKIGEIILKYLQNWKIIFENQQQLQYVEKISRIKNQGFEFPDNNNNSGENDDFNDQVTQLNSKFVVDSEVPLIG